MERSSKHVELFAWSFGRLNAARFKPTLCKTSPIPSFSLTITTVERLSHLSSILYKLCIPVFSLPCQTISNLRDTKTYSSCQSSNNAEKYFSMLVGTRSCIFCKGTMRKYHYFLRWASMGRRKGLAILFYHSINRMCNQDSMRRRSMAQALVCSAGIS